jgi:hypothetical protein
MLYKIAYYCLLMYIIYGWFFLPNNLLAVARKDEVLLNYE